LSSPAGTDASERSHLPNHGIFTPAGQRPIISFTPAHQGPITSFTPAHQRPIISFSISHQLQQIHLSLAPDVTMIYVYISVSCNGTGGLSQTQQQLWLDVLRNRDATNDFLSCYTALVSASAPQDVFCSKNIV